ncbi:protein Abitram [Eupeodes corollae]|uniref:protein Abitram n=1 Tax=Eupeodes corollae TaxID=290404 RepID=UPI002491F43B|nr:protein Abitram [Eupeodes corollae]
MNNEMPIDPFAEFYFKQEPEEICGLPVSSITEEYIEDNPSIVDRFYTRYYYIKPGAKAEPYRVLFHSNRVCLISLAPEHPVFKDGIESISFNIGNMDRSHNQVSGKGKKGGMALQQDSTLALITGNNGQTYKVPSCIRGKLIEVNPRIVNKPELMAEIGDGYLAIVLPKPEHCNEIRASLLTEEQYRSHLKELASRDIKAEL